MRGPLVPVEVPLSRTRAQRFDDLVLDSVARLERRWDKQLASVEFAVEEVPPATLLTDDESVPLSRLVEAGGGRPARIVIYRRPAELRAADDEDLEALVHEVVVEQVADLLGVDPESVDPDYGEI